MLYSLITRLCSLWYVIQSANFPFTYRNLKYMGVLVVLCGGLFLVGTIECSFIYVLHAVCNDVRQVFTPLWSHFSVPKFFQQCISCSVMHNGTETSLYERWSQCSTQAWKVRSSQKQRLQYC